MFSILWHAEINDRGLRGTSLRGALTVLLGGMCTANRRPGWGFRPWGSSGYRYPSHPAAAPLSPTPDTVPGYCGDTTLSPCSSLVNKTDGSSEEEEERREEEDTTTNDI
ncbi:unnamed protein product [Pleuronectes platessa]|uniref:Uncharacterized protein n=1 Tax=Pleuronectes platessa TaxID=8262 RepID=A0A9N7Z6H6_PLEPL|nr:unnamed protein product [Pleuronectes platessa]